MDNRSIVWCKNPKIKKEFNLDINDPIQYALHKRQIRFIFDYTYILYLYMNICTLSIELIGNEDISRIIVKYMRLTDFGQFIDWRWMRYDIDGRLIGKEGEIRLKSFHSMIFTRKRFFSSPSQLYFINKTIKSGIILSNNMINDKYAILDVSENNLILINPIIKPGDYISIGLPDTETDFLYRLESIEGEFSIIGRYCRECHDFCKIIDCAFQAERVCKNHYVKPQYEWLNYSFDNIL